MNQMRWMLMAAAMLFAVLMTGCASVQNNYLTCQDFAAVLARHQIPVTKMQPLNPEVLRASEGMAFEIAGQDIGVYKFNQDQNLRAKRLAQIKKSGCIFLLGCKYPTLIHGSFILIGYEKSKYRNQIIEAFQEFE